LLTTWPLRRHALVWLSQAPVPDLAGDASGVDQWQEAGNPFIVCRRRGADAELSLGFCLPTPGLRPRRIAVQAGHDRIVRIAHPPALEDVAAAHEPLEGSAVDCRGGCVSRPSSGQAFGPAATKWSFRDQVAELIRLSAAFAEADLDVRVFGSWMWQALTGDPHVSPDSDLDVLIDVSTAAAADRAAAFLQAASGYSGLKVDGELSVPKIGEVHWREYLSGRKELLLKSLAGVRMIRRADLWK
jgi:phosphoribosyl-dephospho-CoA transferase